MRTLTIFLFTLFVAQLPEQPIAAQASKAEVQALMQRAQAGDAVAQGELGDNYLMGVGVALSYTEAAKWYRRAADQGFAPARSSLAYPGRRGGPRPDPRRRNHSFAQRLVGPLAGCQDLFG